MKDLVQLLKKKYMIEQRIRSVKTIQNESSKDSAKQLLLKLNEQLEKVKTQIAEEEGYLNPTTYSQKPDHEVQMARSQLYRAAKKAAMLHKVLQELPEENGLEGWVQAKITKASDYLDAVWAYLSYEMRFPYDESVEEAIAAYGPGEDPNAAQTTAPAKPGQTSPTPPAGGATPTAAGTGMVKMSKLDPNKKPIGTPIMVKNTDIPSKQKQGFFVIGESASAGASSAGGIAASPTGFASGGIGMQKRRKKVGEADVDEGFGDRLKKGVKNLKRGLQGWGDAGADYNEPHKNKPKDVVRRAKQLAKDDPEFAKRVAAGKTIKGSPGDLQRRVVQKSLKTEEGTMSDAEKHEGGPKFTGYYKGKDKGRPGNKMVGSD